jgi:hypothetical protein
MPYLTLNDPQATSKAAGPKVPLGGSMEVRVATRSTTPEASGAMAGGPSDDAAVSAMTGYPLVKLDTKIITDATAARLATSLLGHVLFLKNQVPL